MSLISALKIVRCWRCGWYLGKEDIQDGSVEFNCPKCKATTIVSVENKNLTKVENEQE
jgi:phage FluMu protein Com